MAPGTSQPVMPTDDVAFARPWASAGACKSLVGVHVSISSQEIVENTFTQVVDIPLAIRTARASAGWARKTTRIVRTWREIKATNDSTRQQ